MPQYCLALDIGSHSIKAIIAEFEANGWRVVLPIIRKSRGVKNGEIEDVEALSEEILNLLNEASSLLKGVKLKSAIIGINTPRLEVRQSKGSSLVTRADKIISLEDKIRANNSSQVVPLENNRLLVQTVIKDYIIDGSTKVKDPVGLSGLKIEAEALLLDVFASVMKNIDTLREYTNLNFPFRYILPYTSAELVLTKQDKELGALALDLGASTTSVVVYDDGQLLDLKVIPIGGNHITSDIAIGLKIPFDLAEEIKIKEGLALVKKVERGDNFDLSDYFEEAEKNTKVSKKYLVEIIEARLSEIFEKVSDYLKQIGRYQKLPGGVVIYGGGAKMNYLKDLAKEKFKLSVKLAKPEIEWYLNNPDPVFIPVLGLIDFKYKTTESGIVIEKQGLGKTIMEFIKSIFSW